MDDLKVCLGIGSSLRRIIRLIFHSQNLESKSIAYHYVCHIIGDECASVMYRSCIFPLAGFLGIFIVKRKSNLSHHSCKQITITKTTLQNSLCSTILFFTISPLWFAACIGVTIASADELKTHSVKLFIALNSSWRRLPFFFALILNCIWAHASNKLQRRDVTYYIQKTVKRYHCSGIFIEIYNGIIKKVIFGVFFCQAFIEMTFLCGSVMVTTFLLYLHMVSEIFSMP